MFLLFLGVAVTIFLRSCFEREELDEDLRENGGCSSTVSENARASLQELGITVNYTGASKYMHVFKTVA